MTLQNSRRTQRQRESGPRKGDIREGQILDAMEQLLATMAFPDITMDHIAQQSGMSRSALYFYFSSKDAVLAALHERIHALMREPIVILDDPAIDPETAMREALTLTARNWRTHTAALRTFHETALSSPDFGAQWRQRLDHHVEYLMTMVERLQAEGAAAPSPPAPRAIASAWFWMMEHEMYDLFRRRHSRAEEAELVDTLTVLWFRCIGAG